MNTVSSLASVLAQSAPGCAPAARRNGTAWSRSHWRPIPAQDGVGICVVAGQHDDRRLEAVLAQDADRFAAVDVGQADIHDDEVDLSRLGGLHALAAGIDRNGLEFRVRVFESDCPIRRAQSARAGDGGAAVHEAGLD